MIYVYFISEPLSIVFPPAGLPDKKNMSIKHQWSMCYSTWISEPVRVVFPTAGLPSKKRMSIEHQWSMCYSTLTLTVHRPTKSNKGKWRKCAKSDYVIQAGLIWERNRCPGSDTRVACHGWTVHCGAGGHGFETQGEPPFFDPSLSEEIG